MRAIILASILISLLGCGSINSPNSFYSPIDQNRSMSLLDGSNSEDTDSNIHFLLRQYIEFPPKLRVAILKLSNDNYWGQYSIDFAKLNESINSNLVNRLQSTARVYDAAFLPPMLVPKKQTISVLREAAARFQAEALLGFKSTCGTYQKFRLTSPKRYGFKSPNSTESYCAIEAVLIDVKTGIVCKSVTLNQQYAIKGQKTGVQYYEEVKKAELEAISIALDEVANEMASFLNSAAVSVND